MIHDTDKKLKSNKSKQSGNIKRNKYNITIIDWIGTRAPIPKLLHNKPVIEVASIGVKYIYNRAYYAAKINNE